MTVIDVLDTPTDEIRAAKRYTIDVESYSEPFTVVRACGDVDMSARIELVDTLELAARTAEDLLIDLSAVSFMYSGAAAVIIDAAERNESEVRIFAPTRPVRMIIEALGAAHLLTDRLPAGC